MKQGTNFRLCCHGLISSISLRMLILFFLASSLLSLSSCENDDDDASTDHDENKLVEGVISFTGSPAADGCGWLIEIDDIPYSPENLPVEFQKQEEQTVILSYKLLNEKYTCGFPRSTAQGMSMIKINEIKRR